MTRLFAAMAVAGLVALGLAPGAQAADPYFCQGYARTALSQVRQAEHRPRCNYLLSQGARWAYEYEVHFDWCRNAYPGQANAERQARWAALERCSQDHPYPPPGYRPRPWY